MGALRPALCVATHRVRLAGSKLAIPTSRALLSICKHAAQTAWVHDVGWTGLRLSRGSAACADAATCMSSLGQTGTRGNIWHEAD